MTCGTRVLRENRPPRLWTGPELSATTTQCPSMMPNPSTPTASVWETPAVTSRGMKEEEMKKIASFINKAVENWQDEDLLDAMAEEVKTFCAALCPPRGL